MALAPKVEANMGVRDSGLGAEGKRRQRQRNKDSDTRKLTKDSGSSGKALSVAKYPKVPFEDVEDITAHLCDIAGKISHSQVGSSGYLTAMLAVPLEYAHDVLEAHMAGQQGMLYLRVYYVPIEAFLDGEDNDDQQQSA